MLIAVSFLTNLQKSDVVLACQSCDGIDTATRLVMRARLDIPPWKVSPSWDGSAPVRFSGPRLGAARVERHQDGDQRDERSFLPPRPFMSAEQCHAPKLAVFEHGARADDGGVTVRCGWGLSHLALILCSGAAKKPDGVHALGSSRRGIPRPLHRFASERSRRAR